MKTKPILSASAAHHLRVGFMVVMWKTEMIFFRGVEPTEAEMFWAWREFMRVDILNSRRLRPQRPRFRARRPRRR